MASCRGATQHGKAVSAQGRSSRVPKGNVGPELHDSTGFESYQGHLVSSNARRINVGRRLEPDLLAPASREFFCRPGIVTKLEHGSLYPISLVVVRQRGGVIDYQSTSDTTISHQLALAWWDGERIGVRPRQLVDSRRNCQSMGVRGESLVGTGGLCLAKRLSCSFGRALR